MTVAALHFLSFSASLLICSVLRLCFVVRMARKHGQGSGRSLSKQSGWFVQFKSRNEGWSLLIIIDTVDRDQRRLTGALGLTRGAASVRVAKGKVDYFAFWACMEKRRVVLGAAGEILKERRRREIVEQQHKTRMLCSSLPPGCGPVCRVNNSHYQLHS